MNEHELDIDAMYNFLFEKSVLPRGSYDVVCFKEDGSKEIIMFELTRTTTKQQIDAALPEGYVKAIGAKRIR